MHRGDVAAVAREVDLGDDLDVAHGGVVDQTPHLLLREVTAVFLTPLAIYGPYGRIAAAEAAHLRQLGVRADFDAPALVVREVQVQFVDVVVGQQVDITLDSIGSDPRARHVEHHAPVGVARRILDLGAGDRDRQLALPGIDSGGSSRSRAWMPQKTPPAVPPAISMRCGETDSR